MQQPMCTYRVLSFVKTFKIFCSERQLHETRSKAHGFLIIGRLKHARFERYGIESPFGKFVSGVSKPLSSESIVGRSQIRYQKFAG